MAQEQAVVARKRRRVVKPGAFYGILRVIGIILEAIGSAITVASVIGLIALLVKTAPDLASAQSYSEQRMAGFVFLLLLAWLITPLLIGLLGILLAVVGFVIYRLSTRPEAKPGV
jgi:cytochrome b561